MGSIPIVMSLAIRSVGQLRTIAFVGSLALTVVGALQPAWPVIISAAVSVTVHLYVLLVFSRHGLGDQLGS